ncbi:IS3 family transposase [Pseudomonas oligotrophica]|uniref:IS3 family transposase n=1 Tax=Pseudomonas oligotrophica TaxID=2912055 RepID=UPI001F16F7B9|nr:IS3 family transposase [Pseudomonas oligotrophica]MCF7203016.1 hypothetical protein [Pseudomonas oligotrophica]
MPQTKRCFPESFKREAIDQVLAGTPLRHVTETLRIAESLLGNCSADVPAMGHACGRHRVARLMREAGLRARSRKRWRLVSSSHHVSADCPEPPGSPVRLGSRQSALGLEHDLRADGLRLAASAVVLDLYSLAVVGWAMHHRMRQALMHAALARRQPKEEVLLHPDRAANTARTTTRSCFGGILQA